MLHLIKLIALTLFFTQYINLILTKPRQNKYLKLTNVTCQSADNSFIEFSNCEMNEINANLYALNIYIKLKVRNIKNVTILAKLFRKTNKKYRPFLYDDVIDYCAFQRNAKRHIFWNLLYKNLVQYSNINHSCPYNHDLIIKNLTFDSSQLKVLPLPRGQYMLQYKYVIWNVYRCMLEAYATRV